MSRLPIHLKERAKQDLIDIWHYTNEHWGETQADYYLDCLYNDGISIISEHPNIGVDCSEVRNGYRFFAVQRHMIFYSCTTSIVQIVRVLGKEMDYRSHIE